MREPMSWCVRERGPAGPGGTEAGWLVGRNSARRHRQTPAGRLSSPRSLSLTRTTERSARRYRAPRGGPSCLQWRARSRPAAGRWTGTAFVAGSSRSGVGESGAAVLTNIGRVRSRVCWLSVGGALGYRCSPAWILCGRRQVAAREGVPGGEKCGKRPMSAVREGVQYLPR